MSIQQVEDVKDTARKLDKIRECCPEEYFYIKGYIHCLLQKADKENRQCRKCNLENFRNPEKRRL